MLVLTGPLAGIVAARIPLIAIYDSYCRIGLNIPPRANAITLRPLLSQPIKPPIDKFIKAIKKLKPRGLKSRILSLVEDDPLWYPKSMLQLLQEVSVPISAGIFLENIAQFQTQLTF